MLSAVSRYAYCLLIHPATKSISDVSRDITLGARHAFDTVHGVR